MVTTEDNLPKGDPAPLPKGARLGADLRAGLIVFLVALPLCLGIASATGAPPLAGLVAGIVGGAVVALASGAALSVAGPAAGLTVIVADGIERLGLSAFLSATLLAGLMQMALGLLGLGRLAQLVPNAVIRGMLAAIGLILILKQLPHALGYDSDPLGDFAFFQRDGHNTFSELFYSLGQFTSGAVAVSLCAALTMVAWRDYPGLPLRRFLPRELVTVVVGMACALGFADGPLELSPEHRVNVPLLGQVGGVMGLWASPDWSSLTRFEVWKAAFTLAIVASIESLLSVEATDRVDPLRRVTPANRELLAQGLGNSVSGALGGLPVTAVIVRSFVNVQAGAQSRWASVSHGLLLAGATLFAAAALNQIPLAALAVVLIVVGYKLTSPKLYREAYLLGTEHFLPFVTTVLAILLTDLLTGTLLGIAFAVFFIVWGQYRSAMVITDDGGYRLIRFVSSVSFLHKAKLKEAFETAPAGSTIILDGTRARSIDSDMMEAIRELEKLAKSRGITLSITRSNSSFNGFFREESAA